MDRIINDHPKGTHPLAVSLTATNETTLSGIAHRKLLEKGCNEALLDFMIPVLQIHHASLENLERRKNLIKSLGFSDVQLPTSPYPKNLTTQKGNFAEIFLAEYLQSTTDAQIPVYRLRYNPNIEQSMKGDDVLLIDMDSEPLRIIVGEAKFRGVPSKQVIIDTIRALVNSNKVGLPISLMFVADRLFEEGKDELGEKVLNCAVLFANNKLKIDYVGLLMSNLKASNCVNENTTNSLHNLLMISLGVQSPEIIVQQAFSRLEGEI